MRQGAGCLAYNIGALPDFDKKISTIRSRGIFCSLILQSVSQIQSRYPGDVWSSIIGNCASKLLLGANDIVTTKYIKEILGVATVDVESRKRKEIKQLQHLFERTEIARSTRQRYLLTDDEIMRLPQDKAILMMYPHKPLMLKK
ncbi:MAG: conjugal transfer protein TraG, partial [Dehalococcoidia bacterium]